MSSPQWLCSPPCEKKLSKIFDPRNLVLSQDDPFLIEHRKELITNAARHLDKARMIRFDQRTGYLYSTDLGRTASHFYIKYDTIEVRGYKQTNKQISKQEQKTNNGPRFFTPLNLEGLPVN